MKKKICLIILLSFSFVNSFAKDFEITVIDSAIDFTHEYLKKFESKHGVFDVHMNKPLDETKRKLLMFFGEYNHATHVAGIIASYLDNSKPNLGKISNAYFIKVGSKVTGDSFPLLESYLQKTNPRVVNISIAEQYKFAMTHILKSMETKPEDSRDFILSAHNNILKIFNDHMDVQNGHWVELFNRFPNTLFVIAAGNDGRVLAGADAPNSNLPSTWEEYKKELLSGRLLGFKSLVSQINLPNTITVGSYTGDELVMAETSNYGKYVVDILADGHEINSTMPDGKWGVQSGTSMAAPQISGFAASILQDNLGISASDLKKEIYLRSYTSSLFSDYVENGRYFLRN